VYVYGGGEAMIECKGGHFERDVILWAVRWYAAYPIRYGQFEEMMEEHGVEVDHAKLDRWILKYVPRKFATEPLDASSGDMRTAAGDDSSLVRLARPQIRKHHFDDQIFIYRHPFGREQIDLKDRA
jgi:hypothetical protein